ncbi:MAG TPA: hypothetical protein V6D19_06875 [Stenomitos sp.]
MSTSKKKPTVNFDLDMTPAQEAAAEAAFLKDAPGTKPAPKRIRKPAPDWKAVHLWLPKEILPILGEMSLNRQAKLQIKRYGLSQETPNMSWILREIVYDAVEAYQKKQKQSK